MTWKNLTKNNILKKLISHALSWGYNKYLSQIPQRWKSQTFGIFDSEKRHLELIPFQGSFFLKNKHLKNKVTLKHSAPYPNTVIKKNLLTHL